MAGQEPGQCQWPEGCDRPAKPRASTGGPPTLYCWQDGHTSLKANRWRRSNEGTAPEQANDLAPGTSRRVGGVKEFASGGIEVQSDSPRLAALLKGEMSVEDLDDEELARGYPRDRNGRFSGRPPKVVPLTMYRHMQKEFFKRIEDKMRTALPDAVDMLAALATSPMAEDKDKLKAIDMLLTRVMGKPPEKVEITTGDKPFEITMGKMRRKPKHQEPQEAEDGRDGTHSA